MRVPSCVALGYQENWWQILTSAFMRNALIGGTLVALAAGLIGYFVIVRNTAFAAHALAHIGLPGATGAVLLGLPVALGLGVFCIGGALVIGALGKRAGRPRGRHRHGAGAARPGFGLFFNSLATKSSQHGDQRAVRQSAGDHAQQLLTFAALLAVLAAVASASSTGRCCSHRSTPQVAEAKGVPVRALSVVFMALLGLSVTMAVQAVGTLLLFALVVTPAATAIMLTRAAGRGDGDLDGDQRWCRCGRGSRLSAMFNMPPSFVIVTIACGVWLAVWVVERGLRPAADRVVVT